MPLPRSALLASAFLAVATLASTASIRAAAPTWHLNAQVYSFHEHTDDEDLHNTTPASA